MIEIHLQCYLIWNSLFFPCKSVPNPLQIPFPAYSVSFQKREVERIRSEFEAKDERR